MTRKYEALIVLNTKGIDGSIDDLVSAVGKTIESEGGKMEEVRQMGRRKFAYASNHLESGHYVNYVFAAEPDAITRIQAALKLNEKVHLQHFQLG